MKFVSIFNIFQKISTKLFLFVIFVGIIPLLISSYFLTRAFEKALLDSALDEVTLLSDAQEGSFFLYLDSLKKRSVNFSTDDFIQNSLLKINEEEDQEEISLLNEHLVKNEAIVDANILGLNIINLDGRVVSSTNDKEIGRQIEPDDFWNTTLNLKRAEAYVSDLGQFGEFKYESGVLAVSSPIFDIDNDEKIGIIVTYFDTEALDEILIGKYQLRLGALTGLHSDKETLDIYIVNKDKLMISESRFFGKEVFLKQEVNTKPIKECLQSGKEIVGVWDDYRGIPVIGSSMCLKAYSDWTLIVEIDLVEIMKPVVILERSILMGVASLLALILIIGVFFARNISSPIVNLTKILKNKFTPMLASGF